MLHKTKGIVLHTIKFTETSVITKIYTEAFGLRSYIVNGVRNKGAKSKASLFSPMTILDLEIYHRENKNLQRLKDYRPAYIYKSFSHDMIKNSIALFLAEVLYKTIREEEANSELYHFIESSFITLDETQKAAGNFHLVFLLRLTRYLGFFPSITGKETEYFDLKEGEFTGEIPAHNSFISQPHSRWMDKLLRGETASEMNLADRNFLLDKILLYYGLHLHGFKSVNSHRVLHEVLVEMGA